MSRFLSVYVTHTDAGRLKKIMMRSLTVWQLGPIQSEEKDEGRYYCHETKLPSAG